MMNIKKSSENKKISIAINFKSLSFYYSAFSQLASYQKTYNGLSVARFSLHSNLSVDPSFICKSGASIISATASVFHAK
jgi:hypothetical protein